MHSAPSVNYPVGRSRLMGLLLAAVWTAGMLAVAAWTWQARVAGPQIAIAWVIVALAGVFSAIRWVRTPAGALTWDGQAWNWTAGEQRLLEAHPEVVLDLQHSILLRLGEGRGVAWLWLERRTSPARWDDLRRAVYSRARPEGLSGAQPPAAT